jgi:hypothetical protein
MFAGWIDRVVPFTMEFVGLQIDTGKLFIRDLAPDGVFAVIQAAYMDPSGMQELSSLVAAGSRRAHISGL